MTRAKVWPTHRAKARYARQAKNLHRKLRKAAARRKKAK